MASAIRNNTPFSERLASQEVLAGVTVASISLNTRARLASADWSGDALAHGQVCVNDDGTFTQFGTGSSFSPSAILTLQCAPTNDADRDAWLTGLRLVLRGVPRNGDGFAIDALLEWSGQGNAAIADWLDKSTPAARWLAEGGWTANGTVTTGG
jgi:hypothetical protein